MRHFFSPKVRVVLIIAVLLSVAMAIISNLSGLTLPEMMVQWNLRVLCSWRQPHPPTTPVC